MTTPDSPPAISKEMVEELRHRPEWLPELSLDEWGNIVGPDDPRNGDPFVLVRDSDAAGPNRCTAITRSQRNSLFRYFALLANNAGALLSSLERAERMEAALERIANFAPGYGEAAEYIAKIARHALFPELAEMDERARSALQKEQEQT